MEQFLRMLSPELLVWVKENGPKSTAEASTLADVFVAAHKKESAMELQWLDDWECRKQFLEACCMSLPPEVSNSCGLLLRQCFPNNNSFLNLNVCKVLNMRPQGPEWPGFEVKYRVDSSNPTACVGWRSICIKCFPEKMLKVADE